MFGILDCQFRLLKSLQLLTSFLDSELHTSCIIAPDFFPFPHFLKSTPPPQYNNWITRKSAQPWTWDELHRFELVRLEAENLTPSSSVESERFCTFKSSFDGFRTMRSVPLFLEPLDLSRSLPLLPESRCRCSFSRDFLPGSKVLRHWKYFK